MKVVIGLSFDCGGGERYDGRDGCGGRCTIVKVVVHNGESGSESGIKL